MLVKCFDNDWKYTKLEKLMGKAPDDCENLRLFLRSNYKGFRECFKYYGGQDPTG